jgi:AcrR family transcriptional regulator
MKKGDIRKQEILTAAETFFCKKGYEQTSIQDILDRLKLSKGSFYHHFPSKESLLEGICLNRAEQVYHMTEEQMKRENDVLSCLNILLSGMMPLCHEKISFLLMLLPIFHLPEGRSVRNSYCDALAEQFKSTVADMLHNGHQTGVLFCTNPETTADMILLMMNYLWTQICEKIVSAEENGLEPDLSDMMSMVDIYRCATEKILILPYGCLTLLDINILRSVTEQIHNHWKNNIF